MYGISWVPKYLKGKISRIDKQSFYYYFLRNKGRVICYDLASYKFFRWVTRSIFNIEYVREG